MSEHCGHCHGTRIENGKCVLCGTPYSPPKETKSKIKEHHLLGKSCTQSVHVYGTKNRGGEKKERGRKGRK